MLNIFDLKTLINLVKQDIEKIHYYANDPLRVELLENVIDDRKKLLSKLNT